MWVCCLLFDCYVWPLCFCFAIVVDALAPALFYNCLGLLLLLSLLLLCCCCVVVIFAVAAAVGAPVVVTVAVLSLLNC